MFLSICLFLLAFPNLVLAAPSPLQVAIDKRLSSMSTEEKVGQLFMIGFPQREMTPQLETFIQKYKPGSFLLFKRNITSIEQVQRLNSSLYRASYKHTRLPPFIAIDQEGGNVSRLPIFPAPPSALAIGQARSPLLAEGMGYETGRFLREVGFNMNLAPVLDVSDPFSTSFIGIRSFGPDPSVVAEMGSAYASGLLRAHVVPTAKHFPGTGNLSGDPHHGIVKNDSPLAALEASDLKPYESYVKLGENIAVMLSHLIYPALDESGEPASFSKKISTDLLRNQLKYKGLVITDDLQMQGSRAILRPEAAALRAILAGADVVMLTWSRDDQGKAFTHVVNAAKSGALPMEILDTKVSRILTAKAFTNSYRMEANPLSKVTRKRGLTSTSYSTVEARILDQNIKLGLQQGTNEEDKSQDRKPASLVRVCVIAPSKSFVDSFKKNVRAKVETKILEASTSSAQVKSWINSRNCSLTISAVTGKKTAALMSSFNQTEKSKTLVVNLSAPSLVQDSKSFLKVLNLYFPHTDSGKKIAQHLDEILRELNFKIASK